MQSIGPFGAVLVSLIVYGTYIFGVVWLVRTLKRMRRDIADIKEILRQSRNTPTVQE